MKRILVTILLAPNTLFRNGLESVLAPTPYRIQFTASDVGELRCPIPKGRQPLFIVASDHPADKLLETVAGLRKDYEDAAVVVLAAASDAMVCRRVLRAGASAYLLKGITAEVLVKSLDLVAAGGIVISSSAGLDLNVMEEIPVPPPLSLQPVHDRGRAPAPSDAIGCLSHREREILDCIVRGDSNKHIGRHFNITEATVKVHVKAILRKVSARNRTQAAIWAMTHRASGAVTQPNGSAIIERLSRPPLEIIANQEQVSSAA